MDVKGLLTNKIGPFPGWAWMAAAGVGIWYFFLRGQGSSSSSSGVSTDSAYGLGYAQGLQAAGSTGQTAPAAPPATTPVASVTHAPMGRQGVNASGDPTAPGIGGPRLIGPPLRKFHGGDRSAVSMAPHHPALTRRVVYSHFVRAAGGPAYHEQEVQRVAAASGVHPARLMALNPTYTGRIRIA
jgi:hypothetical protein